LFTATERKIDKTDIHCFAYQNDMNTPSATALAHPNIAFIKYWGNRDNHLRLPVSGSISMDLDGLFTRTTVTLDAFLSSDELIINGKPARGGTFISPLLLFMAWADTRKTAGISAAFILVNSIAGLLGNLASLSQLPLTIAYWAPATVIGGYIGAEYGSKRFGNITLKRLLVVVLIIAGLKMIFT
jgi:hypothetical protein